MATDAIAPSQTETIARLNDYARMGKDRSAITMFTTNLLAELSDGKPGSDLVAQSKIAREMRRCTFRDDSPEKDMAWFEVEGVRVMMKIDYFDDTLEWGSQDPADPEKTRRVITMMLPQDY